MLTTVTVVESNEVVVTSLVIDWNVALVCVTVVVTSTVRVLIKVVVPVGITVDRRVTVLVSVVVPKRDRKSLHRSVGHGGDQAGQQKWQHGFVLFHSATAQLYLLFVFLRDP